MDTSVGIHLTRLAGDTDGIDRLTARCGGRVGLAGVLARLDRRARRAPLGRRLGRAVHEAFAWDRWDSFDPAWWPQGVSGSADAAAEGTVDGRRLLAVSWYSRTGKGCRVTFVDLGSLRYRHVLVVQPTLEPVDIHAGGIVWCGRTLHLAATAHGIVSCDLEDVIDTPEHGLVLPVSSTYRAGADRGHARMRYSFLSLDRSSTPPTLVAGEYRHRGAAARLVRYEINLGDGHLVADERGRSWPTGLERDAPTEMQGALILDGTHYVSTSRGQVRRGSVFVGGGGRFREHPYAMPMGPEDLTYEGPRDLLWSVTEHPLRRWFFSMRKASVD